MTIPNVHGNGDLHLAILKAICGDVSGKSMIDLMCHSAPYTPRLGFKNRVYVDIQDREFDFPEEKNFFVKADILKWQHPFSQFDVAFCLDGIEHLSHEDGWQLLDLMQKISALPVIFTPLGETQIKRDAHPDSHKCGWYPEELPDWNTLIFPDWHPTLEVGAWYAWKGNDNAYETLKTIL